MRKKKPIVSRSNLRFTGELDEAELRKIASTFPSDAERSRFLGAIDKSKEASGLMSPPGALGLPPALDAARLKYGITDGAFDIVPSFETIYVHQIAEDNVLFSNRESGLFVPQAKADSEGLTSPRGVLVGAGLKALDILHSNGQQLGDVVAFIEIAPWRLPVDKLGSHELCLLIMKVGDLNGNMSLVERLRSGEVHFEYDEEACQYMYRDREGRLWKPEPAVSRGDY